MIKHLRKHEVIKPVTSSAGSMDRFVQSRSNYEVITKKELDDLLLQTAAACNWSFLQFDNPQFQYFIARAFPDHVAPGRRHMKNLLGKAADKARDEIRSRFTKSSSRISLALDCWISSNSYDFMGMSLM